MASRRRSSSKETTPLPEIPSAIILMSILPRLPARSVLRFMRVSKQWHAFLNTKLFQNMHATSTNDHNNLLVFSATETSPAKFSTIDCEGDDDFDRWRTLPFLAERQQISILTTVHGLVCVGIKNFTRYVNFIEYYRGFILWNPFTREYKWLSTYNSPIECYQRNGRVMALYYSRYEDDYRLLNIINSCNIYIYSLKSNSWRKVESAVNSELISKCKLDCWIPSVLHDENIYFLIQYQPEGKIWLLKFDTRTEEFIKMSSIPFGNRRTDCLRFVVSKGCIHVCAKYGLRKKEKWHIELWRMNAGGKHWTNVSTYWPKTCNPLSPKTGQPLSLQPVHLMSNGNLFMYDHGGHLYIINPSTNKRLKDDDPTLLNEVRMDIPEEGKYIETFVSPNRYIKSQNRYIKSQNRYIKWLFI